ncbi:MAG: LptF/LptG family permease [Treponema sp.]|jgi:lipopolysaccharide export system permease protein|nr:LptF/LptG family permease [Treponema sp.]
MKTIDKYLVKQFVPVFAASLLMFMLLVILIDLFVNLARFLDNGAEMAQILKISVYYFPQSLLYALPVSLLFSSAYMLGDLYSRNELTSMLCSGIPFARLCLPLFLAGAAFSFFSFFFEDNAVIPALRVKKELTSLILRNQNMEGSSDVVIKTGGGRIIYAVDHFDRTSGTLNGVTIIELDENNAFKSLVRAWKAEWDGTAWELSGPASYQYRDGFVKMTEGEERGKFTADPEMFWRSSIAPEDLKARDAALHITDLKNSGLPSASAKADYHHRFSFSTVCFVVIFLSVTLGGRFKKNILLLNLLASLGVAAVFYVIEMVTMMSARVGILPPVMGAWIPVFACTAAGVFLLCYAKT